MKIKEPSELLGIVSKKINQNDILAIMVVFILGLINNFIFITTDGLAPDALSVPDFDFALRWEFTLGRFGIVFVNLLRFGLVNKFIIIILSLLFLAIATIIIIRTFEIKNKIIISLISALIAVAPQFTETYMFIYCADAYCLAFLVASLAVFFLKRSESGKINYLLACICTIIVCSLYQAYLGVILGETIILLISYLLNNIDIKEVLKKALKYVLTIFIGVLGYYIIWKLICAVLGFSLASYKGANSLGINTITSLPQTILQAYKDFFNFFFTNKIINNSYWLRNIINIILFVIVLINLINIIIKNKYDNKKTRIILLILIFPVGIGVMNLIAPGTTTNLVTGTGLIMSIIFVVLMYEKLNNYVSIENMIKYVYIFLICILIWTFILGNTYTYMCREQTYRNYYLVTSDIYNRAVQLDDYSTDKKWMFSDVIRYKPQYEERANGFISDDNVTWNNHGGTMQNSNYFEKFFGIKIEVCSKDVYNEIVKTEEFKEMPIYPNKGSIQIIDNVIVIKVSENTF